jgi:serine/threonine protein kinase
VNVTRSAATLVGQHYRLERKLGEGGCGAVYAATDQRLNRPVAVKLLHRGALAQQDMRGRFLREAQLARQLHHPHTLQLLDFGEDADGTPFIVYELLNGMTLKEQLRVGPLSPRRAAHVARQLLASLSDAHQRGIVHRDIKPANLFLCEFSGEQDYLKVLDFGIARMDGRHAAVTKITQAGFTIGTPSYMAPEQVCDQPVSAATDVYAVGLVMAELLTGRRVVTGESAPHIVMAQASHDPVPLPPAVLQSPLGAIIARATRKPLAERYADAAQMLADLEAVPSASLGDQPLAPAPTTATVAASPSRPWLPWALGAMALLLLVIGGLGAVLAFGGSSAKTKTSKSTNNGRRGSSKDSDTPARRGAAAPSSTQIVSGGAPRSANTPDAATTVPLRHAAFGDSLLDDPRQVPRLADGYRAPKEELRFLRVNAHVLVADYFDTRTFETRRLRIESARVLQRPAPLSPLEEDRDALELSRVPFDKLAAAVGRVRAMCAPARGRIHGIVIEFRRGTPEVTVVVEAPVATGDVDVGIDGSLSGDTTPTSARHAVFPTHLRHARIVERLRAAGWSLAEPENADNLAIAGYALDKGGFGGVVRLSRFTDVAMAKRRVQHLAANAIAAHREGVAVLEASIALEGADPETMGRELIDIVLGKLDPNTLYPAAG